MLILVDIKSFIELTAKVSKHERLKIIAFWLDHVYGIQIPPVFTLRPYYLETEMVWRNAAMLEREYGGIPVKIPYSIYQVDAMDIRQQTLILYIEDDEDLFRRNPSLCNAVDFSSRRRKNSGHGLSRTGEYGRIKLPRLF